MLYTFDNLSLFYDTNIFFRCKEVLLYLNNLKSSFLVISCLCVLRDAFSKLFFSVLWRRDLTLLLFIHIIQAASTSRNLPLSLTENGPEGPPCPSDFCLPWPPHVFSALAPRPSCAAVLQHFLPSRLSLSAFVHVTPCLEDWNVSLQQPPISGFFTLPWGLSWYHPSVLHYERSYSSYHSLQQKNWSSPGSLVPSVLLCSV